MTNLQKINYEVREWLKSLPLALVIGLAFGVGLFIYYTVGFFITPEECKEAPNWVDEIAIHVLLGISIGIATIIISGLSLLLKCGYILINPKDFGIETKITKTINKIPRSVVIGMFVIAVLYWIVLIIIGLIKKYYCL